MNGNRAIAMLVAIVFATMGTDLSALDSTVSFSRYVHKNWYMDDGLPQNSVQALAQTTDGYLWIGTQEGLVRFDGYSFSVFNKRNTALFSEHDARALLGDRSGRLWVGFAEGGLVCYENGIFKPVLNEQGKALRRSRALVQDSEGRIWVGTLDDGLFYIRDQTAVQAPGIKIGRITTLTARRAGGVWVGTDNQGVFFHPGPEHGSPAGLPSGDLPDLSVTALFCDQRDRLWIGTEGGGLYRQAEGRVEVVVYNAEVLDRNMIQSIAADSDGSIWVGTRSGICRVNETSHEWITQITGYDSAPFIRALFFDREGSLWMGTSGNGLRMIHDGSFQTLGIEDGMLNESVWSICGDRDGNLYATTDGTGLDHLVDFRMTRDDLPKELGNLQLLSLCEDGSGGIWLGTYKGLYHLVHGKLSKISLGAEDDENLVHPLYRDRKGALWFGTTSGFGFWHAGKFTKVGDDRLDNSSVFGYAEDASGRLWLATNKGLAHVEGEAVLFIEHLAGYPEKAQINAIYIDHEDQVWMGIDGYGLFWLKGDQIGSIDVKDGLPDNAPFSLIEDDLGYLWFASYRGIFRVKKTDLLEHKPGDNLYFQSFDESDGLKSRECNLGGLPSVYKDKRGKLWFATLGGVAMVDPNSLHQSSGITNVKVEEIIADGRLLLPNRDQILVPANFQRLDIHYGAIEFRSPHRLNFSARLLGYSPLWEADQLGRVASYSRLPAGRYQFEARVGSPLRGYGEARLGLKVAGNWFTLTRVLLLLVLLLGSFAILKLGNAYLRKREKLRWASADLFRMDERRSHLQSEFEGLEKKGKELLAQAERTDIATHLLHNVGNVLNSFSVSSSLIEKNLRTSGINDMVLRIVGLLRKYQDDLPDFFLEQAQGRRVPSALWDLSQLHEDSSLSLNHEIANLFMQTGHLKDIVGTQQDLQRGKAENCDMNILVEDAIKIQSHSLRKFGIKIVHEFQPLPLVRIQKSHLLQILVNLIKNGFEAIRMSEDDDQRVLTLRTKQGKDDSHVVVEVSDSGIGIDPDHLGQIFTHGFTTKQNGHGFGLHYCRNVLREIEGDIEVESPGLGKGATFRVILPV